MITALAAAAVLMPVHSLRQVDGRWAFISPEGSPWWSLAPCCTTPGSGWDQYDPDNPGYAAYRLFPNARAWVQDTQKSLRAWGFNSLGGWSDDGLFRRFGGKERLPYFVVLHLGAYYRAPWDDMFSEGFQKAGAKAARDQILPIKSDPYLAGYFTDNELGWWDDTLFLSYLKLPAGSPGRNRLIQVLRRVYKNSFASLKKDWTAKASSFGELQKGGTLRLKPGSGGMNAVNAWTFELASHYYQSVRRMVKENDSQRLILGDRYAQFWELPVVRASAGQVDAVSTNYGAEFLDGTLSRYFLDTLNSLTGKPVVIGEFYWNAMENQSGNGNTVRAFPIVQTQERRARSAARNLKELAERPYVAGAHWFQFFDHPPKGRGDGEDNNMGLVDTSGRPYPLLVKEFSRFNWKSVKPRAWSSASVVPQAPAKPSEGLEAWPREKGWIKPKEAAAFGDLYLCHDDDALWAGVICSDYIDEGLYEGGRLPEVDRPSVTMNLNGLKTPVTVKFGGRGRRASASQKEVEVWEWPGLKHMLAIRIPWSLFSSRPGRIGLKASMVQHSRAARMSWEGALELR